MVFDALEIVLVVGVYQLPSVCRAAPAPTPVLEVAVGKSEIGTAVVLFTRQAIPRVGLARRLSIKLRKVGGAVGGVGVDES